MSSLEEVPKSKSRDDLHEKLNGRNRITAEWLAGACAVIRTGLSDLQADADKLAAQRSEPISFEIEPLTRAEQLEGFRRLNVQRWNVERILANRVEPALRQDRTVVLIDAAGRFGLENVIEQAMTELFGQAIDLGASGRLITLVRLGLKLIAEAEPFQTSGNDRQK